MTLALTLITRRRVARGEYSAAASQGIPPWQRALARNVVLRSVELALVLTLSLVPLTYTLLRLAIHAGLCGADWPFGALAAFFVVYFCVLSLIVTPTVVRRALAD